MPYDLFLSNPEVQPKDLRLRVRAPSGGGAVAYARTATEAVSPPVSSAQRRTDAVRSVATLGSLAGDQALRVLALARRADEATGVDAVSLRATGLTRSASLVLSGQDQALRRVDAARQASEALTVLDQAARTVSASRSSTESLGVLDEAFRVFVATRETSALVILADQATRQVSVTRRLEESSTEPAAVASKALLFARDLSVVALLADAASRTVDARRLGLELSAVLVTTSVRTQELMRAAGETVDQVQALSVRELLTARGPSVLLDVSDTTTRVVVVARVAAVETLAVAGVERVVSYGREALDQVLLMQGITVGFLVLRRRPVRLALQATGPALTFAIVEHLS